MAQSSNIEPRTDQFITQYRILKEKGKFKGNKELAGILGYKSENAITEILGRRQNIPADKWNLFKQHFLSTEKPETSVEESDLRTLIRSNAVLTDTIRACQEDQRELIHMLRATVGGREGMKEADASMFGTILDLVLRVGVDAGSWKTVAEGKKELGKQASDNAPDKKLTGKN